MHAGAHLSWQVGLPRWLFVPNSALMSRQTGRKVKGRDSGRAEEEEEEG